MNVIPIIDKKRRGNTHTEAEIRDLVQGVMAGNVDDAQLSAWLMAVCINGLTLDETTWLTDAFVQSGEILEFSGIDGVIVDKHSTGGVGDKTTLVLLPLLAVSGVKMAKLSGRGLGFTGGTVDKLEAIPNFNVCLSNEEMLVQIKNIGVAISSQTPELAPADAKFYALRDVTATVDSIPLIAASVVSKKIAAGASVIVLDIKFGQGAFMKTLAEAQQLAETCREVGERLGKTLLTVLSSMEQPLGNAVGHSLEVLEVLDTLQGNGPDDLRELCLILGGLTLVGAKLQPDLASVKSTLAKHLDDGSAYKKFQEIVKAQGGDTGIFKDASTLPRAKTVIPITANASGYVETLNALNVAQAAKLVGAGRQRKEDAINLGVGVVLHKKIGDAVNSGDTLAELHSDTQHDQATQLLEEAFTISSKSGPAPVLIAE